MKRLRTLIVDDEPLAIERLETLSADHPAIEVVGTANDGVEALRLAQQLTPDLIFLDIGMPKMDGINAARALGLMHKKPAIILITAYDNFAVEAFDLEKVVREVAYAEQENFYFGFGGGSSVTSSNTDW